MSEAQKLERRGKRLLQKGNLSEAEGVLKQCISIFETEPGCEGCEGMHGPLYDLVFCLVQTRKHSEAEQIVARCLSIKEADLGPNSKHLTEILHMAAVLSMQAGRKERAESMFKRCLTIQEAELGRNDVKLDATLLALGECLSVEKKLNEADAVLRRSLAIFEATMGGHHDPKSTTLDGANYRNLQQGVHCAIYALAGCFGHAGKVEDAEVMLSCSLAAQQAKLVRDNAKRATSQDGSSVTLGYMLASALNSLGGCLLQAGEEEEAEKLLTRCLLSAELSREDDSIAFALQELSSCFEQTGQLRQAGLLLRRCLQIREAKLGADNSLVIRTRLELGLCHAQVIQPEEAERILRHCLAVADANLDPSDILIANTLRPLAACLSEIDKMEEAQSALRRCLAIQEAKLGGDNIGLAFTLHQIGLHLVQSGELEEAEETLKRCLAIQEAASGQCSSLMSSTQLELGISHRARDHERWGQEVRPGRALAVGSSTLHILDELDWEYKALCNLFKTQWRKPQPSSGVPIARIFSIQDRWRKNFCSFSTPLRLLPPRPRKMPPAVRNKHDRHKLKVWIAPCQLFHGTYCSEACNFIANPLEEAPCELSSCSVCSICKLGFTLRDNVGRTARATNFSLRYGRGIYLTSVSGKANDYAFAKTSSSKPLTGGRKLRCMFVAHVAMGKSYVTNAKRLPQTECPPRGYESVAGEVGPALNHDEFVVYHEEAALPTHLIVYSPP